jgi:hypothetical protein
LLEALSKPISLVVAGLSLIGFLVGLGTAGLMEAFSVVGVFYFLAAPIIALFACWPPRQQGWFLRIFSVFMVICLLAWPLEVIGALNENLARIGIFSIFGIGAALGVTGLLAAVLIGDYKQNHQTCPECMNVIHARARVCHFCGFRFQSPVPSPLARK